MADAKFEPEVKRGLKRLKSTVPIAIECKRTEQPRLALFEIKEHQIAALSRFQLSPFVKKISVPAAVGNDSQRFNLKTEFDFVYCGPGKSYILVNFRFTRKAPNKRIPKGTNMAFALTIGQFKVAKAFCEAKKRVSIPYSWFEEYATELKRIKFDDGYGWDLSPLGMDELELAANK